MANPWESDGVFIVSRDLLKTEAVLGSFAAAQRPWDLAVLDEAHGYTLKINKRGAIDNRTGRYKAAERVARHTERLLLLTATPHSGREESLWGLMRLLDRDAYGDRCPERVEIMPHHYSRTTKEQMVDLRGNPLFRPRFAHTVADALDGAGAGPARPGVTVHHPGSRLRSAASAPTVAARLCPASSTTMTAAGVLVRAICEVQRAGRAPGAGLERADSPLPRTSRWTLLAQNTYHGDRPEDWAAAALEEQALDRLPLQGPARYSRLEARLLVAGRASRRAHFAGGEIEFSASDGRSSTKTELQT